jgi:DNA-binding transcriptional regulator YiaG
MPAHDKYLNTIATAAVLGFHPGTVERMCREGRIPARKMDNNKWSIDKNGLEKYLADSRLKADCVRELGQKLKSERNQLGLSQPELAVTLGISSAAISRWEHGNRTPWMKHSQQILLWLEQID